MAALLGGALNSVAGGGSFIVFPALIFSGVPTIIANATNKVALWPGSLASVVGYRREFANQDQSLVAFTGIGLVGGILGALLLLFTSERLFAALVPYFLLLATLLFTFSKPISARLKILLERSGAWTNWIFFFLIAVYGGYFGGGIGILTLTVLALSGMSNIHTMNALKNLLVSMINGVAVIVFAISGAVAWPEAALMAIGAMIGGYFSADITRRLDQQLVRRFIIVIGFTITIIFFVR